MEEVLLNSLAVYSPVQSKKRYGTAGDGGYVVIDGYQYDFYVGCGVGDNIAFDMDMIRDHPAVKGSVFDGTIGYTPRFSENVVFVRKNIAEENTETTTNLNQETAAYKDVFIKMDIESHEWKWLNRFENLDRVKQMVIEVHGLFDPSWTSIGHYEYTNIYSALQKINKTHYLAHFHSNSAAEYRVVRGLTVPTVAELTFIRKRDCIITGMNKTPLPIAGLDFCNNSSARPDLLFDTPPFCFKD